MHAAGRRPLVVKFLARGRRARKADLWLRQFPGRDPQWRDCRFVFDPDARHYDWLVVYDDLPAMGEERFSVAREVLACPREHTLLVTTEPSPIKIYGADFLGQFGAVLTSQEPWAVPHPRVIRSQCGLVWFYGLGRGDKVDHDAMKARQPPDKPGLISTVCSMKGQRHTRHHRRLRFTRRLKEAMPELELYGRGVREVADKAEAIDPYRYHLAVENHTAEHHWTEKLADPLLGFALPLYGGCPNAADYIPEESLIAIDIDRFEDALERIRRAIRDDEYRARLPHVVEARRRILDEHNLFALLAREIGRLHGAVAPGSVGGTLYSRHALRRRSLTGTVRYLVERATLRARRLRASSA